MFEEWTTSILHARKALALLESRNGLYVLYMDRVTGELAKLVGQISSLQKLNPDVLDNLFRWRLPCIISCKWVVFVKLLASYDIIGLHLDTGELKQKERATESNWRGDTYFFRNFYLCFWFSFNLSDIQKEPKAVFHKKTWEFCTGIRQAEFVGIVQLTIMIRFKTTHDSTCLPAHMWLCFVSMSVALVINRIK